MAVGSELLPLASLALTMGGEATRHQALLWMVITFPLKKARAKLHGGMSTSENMTRASGLTHMQELLLSGAGMSFITRGNYTVHPLLTDPMGKQAWVGFFCFPLCPSKKKSLCTF